MNFYFLFTVASLLISGDGRAEEYRAKYQPTSEYAAMDVNEQKEFDQMMDRGIQSICDSEAQIKSAQKTIATQKKIGAVSGAVSLTALHNAGAAIVQLTEQRDAGLKTYKEVLGKSFNLGACDE